MRQIKFRAWVKSGDYSEMLFNAQNHIGAATGFGHLIQGTAKGIDESHVMQFTGLTDINGVEIYEGDIVRLSFDDGVTYMFKVVYKEPAFGLEGFGMWSLASQSASTEVIGNIYQNPELLK